MTTFIPRCPKYLAFCSKWCCDLLDRHAFRLDSQSSIKYTHMRNGPSVVATHHIYPSIVKPFCEKEIYVLNGKWLNMKNDVTYINNLRTKGAKRTPLECLKLACFECKYDKSSPLPASAQIACCIKSDCTNYYHRPVPAPHYRSINLPEATQAIILLRKIQLDSLCGNLHN